MLLTYRLGTKENLTIASTNVLTPQCSKAQVTNHT